MTDLEARSWLLMAAGDDRQHGGNTGYDDQADVYYTWDNTVSHHADIKIGDTIALWDKQRLLGISIIEDIQTEEKRKLLLRCPKCSKAGIKARTTKSPRYKCYKCKHTFEKPIELLATVLEYRSRHDAAWRDLTNVLTGAELRRLCEAEKSQQSLRPLRWDAIRSVLGERGYARSVMTVEGRDPRGVVPGGHLLATVRVRLGQQAFRQALLDTQGQTCAFTGSAPAAVLEAGHLYSYAEIGRHHPHGGLLLRRDVHRLFDDGALAVSPDRMEVDVSPVLEPYPQYASLHGLHLKAKVNAAQETWLAEHWNQHRVEVPSESHPSPRRLDLAF